MLAYEDVWLTVALLVGSSYVFLCLSILADEHLSKSLEDMSAALKVPPSVSAATFVAFGSSAPELVISAVGAASDNTELTIPTLLASALVAFGLIPALCVLDSERSFVLKDPLSHLRDSFAFAVALFLVAAYATRPRTNLWQSVVLVVLYFAYVVTVYFVHQEEDDDDEEEDEESLVRRRTYGGTDAIEESSEERKRRVHFASYDVGAGPEQHHEHSKLLARDEETPRWRTVLEWPIRSICDSTIRGGPFQRFLTTLTYVALLSYFAVYAATLFTQVVRISHATAGMTVLALGAQVPDLIAALELARNGHADSGISQAVGSQVINVTLGLGLPYLFYILSSGNKVRTDNNSTIVNLSVLVFAMLFLYASIVLVFCSRGSRTTRDGDVDETTSVYRVTVRRWHGWLLFLVFLALYALGILSAELKWPRSYRFLDGLP
mmetsp:Transcript_23342/g.71806  ORF Transcript_23342/g.71806 Transcript_23342/m.71806 type:complete len:436 (-) Transcript_23342:118-1425(-)